MSQQFKALDIAQGRIQVVMKKVNDMLQLKACVGCNAIHHDCVLSYRSLPKSLLAPPWPLMTLRKLSSVSHPFAAFLTPLPTRLPPERH